MRLATLFSDHMVLQHSMPIPVWGWSEPGAEISVTLSGHSARAKADSNGAWRVNLPAIEAGGPYRLKVQGPETIEIEDILAGEVWICSGQSNMEWPLELTRDAKTDIPAANHPQIRL